MDHTFVIANEFPLANRRVYQTFACVIMHLMIICKQSGSRRVERRVECEC
jgi:hypothetical protein